MKKQTLSVARLLSIAAAAGLALAGTASAQPLFEGEFTLPYEVRWGSAVLPAGAYTITFESAYRPAVVRRVAGGSVLFMPTLLVDDARKDQGTALLITRGEHGRIVRSFNWVEGGKSFVYKPITKAERGLLARAGGMERVAMSRLRRQLD